MPPVHDWFKTFISSVWLAFLMWMLIFLLAPHAEWWVYLIAGILGGHLYALWERRKK